MTNLIRMRHSPHFWSWFCWMNEWMFVELSAAIDYYEAQYVPQPKYRFIPIYGRGVIGV